MRNVSLCFLFVGVLGMLTSCQQETSLSTEPVEFPTRSVAARLMAGGVPARYWQSTDSVQIKAVATDYRVLLDTAFSLVGKSGILSLRSVAVNQNLGIKLSAKGFTQGYQIWSGEAMAGASSQAQSMALVAQVSDTASGVPWYLILPIPWDSGKTYGSVQDGGGQSYKTVVIGNQTWMAENLNDSKGGAIGHCYNDSARNCARYGQLYTWAEAMGLNDSCNTKSCTSQVLVKHRGICPAGWHVPNDAEWHTLTEVSMDSATAGTNLKSKFGWKSGNGTDDYGFRVLPAGFRNYDGSYDGSFVDLGVNVLFWSASEDGGIYPWFRSFSGGNARVYRSSSDASVGCSLRCIQD